MTLSFDDYQAGCDRTSSLSRARYTPELRGELAQILDKGESNVAQVNEAVAIWANHLRGRERLLMALAGLSGEVGEWSDLVKKVLWHEHPLDEDQYIKELGDVLFYIAEACSVRGLRLEDVAQANQDKLRLRYPDGFSATASLNRTAESTNQGDPPCDP
jgi:NTP pyrophosphatase (non-canonical NTP hydrolase)